MSELLKGDRIVWIVFMVLCCISLVEVFSAASTLSYKSGDYLAPITSHCITLFCGVVVVYVLHLMPYKFFRLIPFTLLPLSALLLAVVMVMGMVADERVNGASRWLFGFQPSEMGKMSLVVTMAYLLSRFQTADGCSPLAFRPILLVTVVMLGLIAPENGSTALLLAAVVYMQMLIGRVPWRQLGKLTGGVVLLGALAVSFIMLVPPSVYEGVPGTHRFVTWRNRLTGFAGSEVVPATKFDIDGDAQVAHANIAIATSNVIGKGPGNSVQRDHLSHSYSDYIYAIVIEELGLLGGAFVVLLYIILLFRVGQIAKRCHEYFGIFLITGVGLLLVSQAMMHMLVNVGLFPVTGQPLPLISKGGTSIIINSVYIGMILSVSRTVDERQAQLAAETDKTENLLPSNQDKQQKGTES